MSTKSCPLNLALVHGGSILRTRWLPLASVAVALVTFVQAPLQAQVASDALVQLEMLDTSIDDLMRLGTSYADALRNLKAARLSIDTVKTLRPTAVVTNLEVQIAGLNLEAAERKVTVLRLILEKQLAAAENKLEIVSYLEKVGSPLGKQNGEKGGERNFIRANDEMTVKILKTILAMK